jgi:hypothetical protein
MSRIGQFFHGSETTLGVFYPFHCITAVFPDYETTEQIAKKLRGVGFSEEDILAATGAELLEHESQETTIDSLMKEFSRLFRSEQLDIDHDLKHAREGAGFLIVRCLNERSKIVAWPIIKSGHPLDARYYATGAIEHLAGTHKTG